MSRLTLLDWRRRVFDLYRRVRDESDPVAGHQLWRQGRDDLFATHPDSPVDRATFTGLRVAPYDPAYRFEVDVEEADPLLLAGAAEPMERIGAVRLPGLGQLDVWWIDVYGGGVFLPVKDALAGAQTYGGGRYVLDTVKGADLGGGGAGRGDAIGTAGRLVVDLNFAYNPSCAHDPRWVCPLAPPGNVLGAAVYAGELYVP